MTRLIFLSVCLFRFCFFEFPPPPLVLLLDHRVPLVIDTHTHTDRCIEHVMLFFFAALSHFSALLFTIIIIIIIIISMFRLSSFSCLYSIFVNVGIANEWEASDGVYVSWGRWRERSLMMMKWDTSGRWHPCGHLWRAAHKRLERPKDQRDDDDDD